MAATTRGGSLPGTLAAVTGSYYLQSQQWSWNALLLGAAVGLPAAAVLLINNYRDLDTDRGEFIFPTTTPPHFEPTEAHKAVDRIMAQDPMRKYDPQEMKLQMQCPLLNPHHSQLHMCNCQ